MTFCTNEPTGHFVSNRIHWFSELCVAPLWEEVAGVRGEYPEWGDVYRWALPGLRLARIHRSRIVASVSPRTAERRCTSVFVASRSPRSRRE